MDNASRPHVLLTGFTRTVGKVVVEHLCRQQNDGELLPLDITLIIRRAGEMTAAQRFDRIQHSICFSQLAPGWQHRINVVEADLRQPDLGLSGDGYRSLSQRITHIIHCAASTAFDDPLQEALKSNVDGSIHLLEFARACPRLRCMVDTSTSYVHTKTALMCTPRPLTRSQRHWARCPPDGLPMNYIHRAIKDGGVSDTELLRTSGHPTTYNLTKCLAEHLLVLRQGHVPLRIVRPSIIGGSMQHPFPGYTDSYGAISGYVALLGSGLLHVMEADASTLIDVVPVDIVAQRLIDISEIARFGITDHTVATGGRSPVAITHCVAGLQKCVTIDLVNTIVVAHFAANPGQRRFQWKYTGPRDIAYHWYILTSQTIPIALACLWLAATRQQKRHKLAKTLQRSIEKCNSGFPYFMSNTFDFTTSHALPEDFDKEAYIHALVTGVHRHLIKRELWKGEGGQHEGSRR